MYRIVHLDLKGAPLKLVYLENVLRAAKSWGATGVLLEWEDTFPYSSELETIGSKSECGGDGMYTLEEVHHIMKFCKQHNLEVIQLVQTIGHMEYVLKHSNYKDLRELPRSPAVLCPSKPQSQYLVQKMVSQILDVQLDATYLHIGADEVWYSGVCAECQQRAAASEYKLAHLYLSHIRELTSFIKQLRPNLTVLIWDDMLRSMSLDALKEYQLDKLVQPVVWNYNHVQYFNISDSLWEMYGILFPKVWVASAFKGANGSSQVLASASRYASNHEAWLQEMDKQASRVDFVGCILTGWSRYCHYATLCELMPVALPSLASCLRVLQKPVEVSTDTLVSEVLPSPEWPGERLAHCIQFFLMLRDRIYGFLHGELISTWLNPWQREKAYTSPDKVDEIARIADSLFVELMKLESEIRTQLEGVTGPRSVQEWMMSHVSPVCGRLAEVRDIARVRTELGASVAPAP